MALLTVITVVKDDAAGLSRTLGSLSAQERGDFELVIIDGSKDRSEVEELLAAHSQLTVIYEWHEPQGVYSAMNTGIAAAHGEYTYFLNAGDTLASPDVLPRVTSVLTGRSPVWAFGHVLFRQADGSVMAEPHWSYDLERKHYFARGRFPSHQGVIMRTDELRRQDGFDTSYAVAADYVSILICSTIARPLELGLTLAEFTVGGLSTVRWRQAQREFHRARISILDPVGLDSIRERAHTWRAFAATAAYRTLWAPGRPAHGLMSRIRAR